MTDTLQKPKTLSQFFPIRDAIRDTNFFQMFELKAAETYRSLPNIQSLINFIAFGKNEAGEDIIQQQFVLLNPEVVIKDEHYQALLEKAFSMVEQIDEIAEEPNPNRRRALFIAQFLMSVCQQALKTPDNLSLLTPTTIALLTKSMTDEPSPILTVVVRQASSDAEWGFLGCSPNTHVERGSSEIK